ncbi:MAG: carbonic anhydrase [Rhodospirillaceae bacterium]|nr:carbonic anhydrase [Rhodospirillaceae bacterium]
MRNSAPGLPDLLTDGYARFRETDFPRHEATYRALAEGQEPPVMVISCCDSRVDPEAIFDAGPGELFVVRNVANLVPPCDLDGGDCGTGAAIAFAVEGLGVGDIVVMGHSGCGGIRAYIESRGARPGETGAPSFIGKWISTVRGAEARLPADAPKEGPGLQEAFEYASIRNSLDNLMTFPIVRQAVDAGRLKLHGAHFSIADGRLTVLDPASGNAAVPE